VVLELAEAHDDEVGVPIDSGFDTFVRTRSQALCRTAFLLTGDHHLAEDLTQVALAKVSGRWEQITANGDPMPYVRTVMLRAAIAWRRRRSYGEIPIGHVPERAVEPVSARMDELRAALAKLTARQRAVIVLRFYEDLTEVETARILRCSVGTVKSQTAKARARLRAALGTPTGPIEPEES
jgi:RNA polymerase sigma-70 factor (sigma-E family)